MSQKPGIFRRPFFIRLFHWEYWSFNAIYGWVMPWWLWLSIRARSFFFFNASNPGIENGGMVNESKKDIHQIIPASLMPVTRHFSIPADPLQVWKTLQDAGMNFPVMGKPDVGGRGRGVKKLENFEALSHYAMHATMDFHIQSFIPYIKEVGIFYYRMPGAKKGCVTGIVRKEFLTVVGDGRSSIRALLAQDQRGSIYLGQLEKSMGKELDSVPAVGVRHIVSPYGNHARGALFIDDSHTIDEQLRHRMDEIADLIPGFYYGRLDIRFQEWEQFLRGENFTIIELNGAGAEPTHMYDPRHSIFFAWKEIIRHWTLLYKVSRANHALGIPYLSYRQGRAVFKKDKALSEKLAAMPI